MYFLDAASWFCKTWYHMYEVATAYHWSSYRRCYRLLSIAAEAFVRRSSAATDVDYIFVPRRLSLSYGVYFARLVLYEQL